MTKNVRNFKSCRSGSSNVSSGINKLDGTSLPAGSSARAISKNEWDKASLSRDSVALSKERIIAKGNNKYVCTP